MPTKKTPNYKKVLDQIDASLRNAAIQKLKYDKVEPTGQVLAYENDEFAVYYKTKKGKKANHHEEAEEAEELADDLATAEIYDPNNDMSDSGESDADESDLLYHTEAEMVLEDAAAAAGSGPYNRLNSNRLNDEIYMNMPINEYQAFGKTTDRLIFDGEETYGMDNNVDKYYDIKTRSNAYGKPTEDPRKKYYLGLLANQYKEEKSDEDSDDNEEADKSKFSTHDNLVNSHYPSSKSTNTGPYNNLNSNRLNEELYGHMPISEYQAFGKNTDRLIFDGEETFGIDNNIDKAYEIKTRSNAYGKPVEDPRETYYLGLLANKQKNDHYKSLAKLKTLKAAYKQPSYRKTKRY